MSTMTVLDSTGATKTVQLPNGNGRGAATASRPVAISNEDKAAIDLISSKLDDAITAISALNTKMDDLAQQSTLSAASASLDGINSNIPLVAQTTDINSLNTLLTGITDLLTNISTQVTASAASLASIDSKTPTPP